MTLRDYFQLGIAEHRYCNITMVNIPNAAVRYDRFQMGLSPKHLAGSQKSQLLNNINRNSLCVQFRHSYQRMDTLPYRYVDYHTCIEMHIGINDVHVNYYLARIFLQPVEIIDPDNQLIIKLALRPRTGRRRCRNELRPHWVWKLIGDITCVVGSLTVDDATYIIMTPFYQPQELLNSAVAFMDINGNGAA